MTNGFTTLRCCAIACSLSFTDNSLISYLLSLVQLSGNAEAIAPTEMEALQAIEVTWGSMSYEESLD